jgi:flagellar motor switch protein FliN/FliY
MALISQLPIADAGLAAARALEQLLGHDVVLGVGELTEGQPSAATLPAGETRCVALPFVGDVPGDVTMVIAAHFATTLQAAATGADLTAAAMPVLDAAVSALGLQSNPDHAGEISIDTLLSAAIGDFVSIAVVEDDEHVASVVVRVVDVVPAAAVTADDTPVAAPAVPRVSAPVVAPVVATPAPPAAMAAAPAVSLHEFQPLGEGGAPLGAARSITLLNDVQMEVTAELGRHRMTVRELMSLQPGSVIELDRAAGSPVDVLVNGSLLAHGEVVVIDEEFGVRVSEIVVGEN